MEIVPMLDAGCQAVPGMWYLLSAEDEGPSARVGHASLVCQCYDANDEEKQPDGELSSSSSTKKSRLMIVGGATPSGPFDDVYYLEMCSTRYKWSKMDAEGLVPRYEHGIVLNQNSDVFVFAGAQKDHNLNSIQVLMKGSNKWEEVTPKGSLPAPRTCLNTATIDHRLYVFGGGLQGAKPVSDTHIYIFNADECSWMQPKCTGRQPGPRHGHVMVAVGKRIYIHGGMNENELYDELFSLDTETNVWDEIEQSGDIPASRAAHAGVAVENSMFIYGGMNFMGPLNDLYKFDIDSMVWTKIDIQGCPPPPRLDHTLCCIEHFVENKNGDESDGLSGYTTQKLLVSFGGMDTTGQIFDDLFAIAVA